MRSHGTLETRTRTWRISLNHQIQFNVGEFEVVDTTPGSFVGDVLGLVEPITLSAIALSYESPTADVADRRDRAGVGQAVAVADRGVLPRFKWSSQHVLLCGS